MAHEVRKCDCPCEQDDEIFRYTESVRAYIQREDGTIFQNNSDKHAYVIISEFLSAAKETVRIFCGKLSARIYERLLPAFMLAKNRGVDVQVVAASDYGDLESDELKKYLNENGMLRCRPELCKYPHFLLIDSKRFRLEVSQEKKEAIVCASATSDGAKEIACGLANLFPRIWGKSRTSPANAQ